MPSAIKIRGRYPSILFALLMSINPGEVNFVKSHHEYGSGTNSLMSSVSVKVAFAAIEKGARTSLYLLPLNLLPIQLCNLLVPMKENWTGLLTALPTFDGIEGTDKKVLLSLPSMPA